jgi:hypothetical protein
VPGNYDLNIIPLAVSVAEADGIPQSAIVPIYQAFGGGGYSTYILPTAAQEQQILTTWGSVIPAPMFDYAYSWGVQDGDTALSTDPALQQVLAAHNSASSSAASASVLAATAPAAVLASASTGAAAATMTNDTAESSASRHSYALPSEEFASFAQLLAAERSSGSMFVIGSSGADGQALFDLNIAAAAQPRANFALHG